MCVADDLFQSSRPRVDMTPATQLMAVPRTIGVLKDNATKLHLFLDDLFSNLVLCY